MGTLGVGRIHYRIAAFIRKKTNGTHARDLAPRFAGRIARFARQRQFPLKDNQIVVLRVVQSSSSGAIRIDPVLWFQHHALLVNGLDKSGKTLFSSSYSKPPNSETTVVVFLLFNLIVA
jgi:hypothetical protein